MANMQTSCRLTPGEYYERPRQHPTPSAILEPESRLSSEPTRSFGSVTRLCSSTDMGKTVAVNERGMRIGEDHQNAIYTDGEIEMVLKLRDEGFSYGFIVKKMDMPKSTVRDICTGKRRCQFAVRFKVVLGGV